MPSSFPGATGVPRDAQRQATATDGRSCWDPGVEGSGGRKTGVSCRRQAGGGVGHGGPYQVVLGAPGIVPSCVPQQHHLGHHQGVVPREDALPAKGRSWWVGGGGRTGTCWAGAHAAVLWCIHPQPTSRSTDQLTRTGRFSGSQCTPPGPSARGSFESFGGGPCMEGEGGGTTGGQHEGSSDELFPTPPPPHAHTPFTTPQRTNTESTTAGW
jgi:hypothetical protein